MILLRLIRLQDCCFVLVSGCNGVRGGSSIVLHSCLDRGGTIRDPACFPWLCGRGAEEQAAASGGDSYFDAVRPSLESHVERGCPQ